MEPTANDMLSDVVPSNGTGAQSAFDKVISQRQKKSVEQTETGLGESQSTFDTVIQQRKSPKTQLNSTFASVSGINPDDAAKAQQVGGAIGLGQDLTMRNAAEVKRIADQKRFEMYDLMESDPILGRQMMRREFASVAHDDIPQLTSVGALFKVAYSAATLSPFPKDVALEISQQYEGTQYQTEEALIYHWMNNNNLEEKDLSEETRQRLNFLEQNAPPPINTYLFGGLSYAAGQARSMAPEVAKYAIAGGVTGGALGLAGGPLAPVTVAGGVLTGIGLGATAGVGVVTSQIESGMLYKDLLRSGVPKETARTASRIGGTISGLIEMGTLGLAVAPFKMVIKKTVGDVIATRLEKTTVGSAVKTAGKYYAMSEGGEQIEELSQYATAVAVEEFAKSFTDSDYVTIFETPEGRKKFIEQMVDISYQTWKATAIIGSFGPVLNLAVDAKNIRDSAKTKQFLTDLSKNVQATKLKGRSPSALANFVAAQAQGTAAETMYVDSEEMVNVLNQSGLTVQQIDNALPGVREQLAQATSGGDIQIPTAQFAANIVGTKLEAPLMENARFDPKDISAKQTIARLATREQDIKDAQAEMAVQEKTNAQFVREAKEIEKVVNDQLVAAGRPVTEAAFAAKLVQARAVTGAAAAGITPAQWVAQHPVPTFRSQRQAAQAAQQAPAKPFVPKVYQETTVTPEQTASLSEPLVAAESELAEAKTANSITERGGKQIGDSLSRLKMALTSGKLGEIGAQTWKLLERLKEIPGMKAASELASKTLAALTKLGVEFYDPTGSVYVEGWVEVEVISWLPYEEGVSKDQPFVEKVISPIVRRNGQIIQRGQVQVREGRIDHEAYLEIQAKDAEIEAKMQSELDALQAKLKEEGKTDEVIKQLVAERKAELEAKAREEQYGKEAQQAPAQGSLEQAAKLTLASVEQSFAELGVEQRLTETATTIRPGIIRVPKELQNQGRATNAMQNLIAYADQSGKRIDISPTGEFGANKKRLIAWYKNLGFVENKGANKDFAISATMYREPRANVGTFGQQDPNILNQAAVPATAMPSVTTANPVSPIGLAIASANLNGVKSVEESDTFFKKVWKKLLIASGKQMRSKSDESVKEAAKLAVADIQDFVKNNPQFSDYYSQDWMKTRSLLDEYAGRAITDDEFQMYRVICGLTSPNTQLPSNISDTVKLWTHWMENGSFDGFLLGPKPITGASVVFESDEVVSGTTANIKIRTVKIIARLVKELGSVKAAIDFLREPVTGAELNKVNKSLGYAGNVSNIGNIRALVKMATGQDKLIPRMFIFGQKVGAYTLNAVGDERFTTVDIWESRYIRSFFSGMFENEIGLPTDEKEHDTFVRFGYAFKDEMERVTGRTWTPSSLQALRWFYIIAATRSAGYSKASTNETISTYTSRVLQKQFDYNQSRKLNATRSTTTPPRRIVPQKYERDLNTDLDAKGITDPKQRQQITTGSWIQFARSNRIGNEVGFQFDTNRSGVPRRSGPLKGLATVATHTPGSQLAKAFAKAGASIQPYVELAQTEIGAKAFSDRVRAINANSKFGTAVYVYSDAEYMGKRLFISESGKSGFALSSDGDIVSVFSEAGSREGRGAMALATQMGGTKLDCFDTVLPGYYAAHGFRAVARVKWSDEYTPTGWDFNAFAQFNGGRPDVVYMVYEANYSDSYSNKDGVVVADPSEAVAIQTQDIKTEQDRVAANEARYAEVIKPSQTLFQAATGGTRGEIDPVRNLITIKNANSLTVFHELMHWFVIDLFRTATDPAASELSKSDADILLKWFGIGGSNMQERIANWNAMTLEEQRRHHETAAYNAEIWVATGRAPSVELQGVFERFRRWATRAYKSIRDDLNDIYRDQFGIDLPFLTDEVRGVFDRMLASEEQILRREAIDNFKGMYQTQEESGMNDATWAAYQAELAEAHEMAVTDLTKATVKQMEWLSGARKGILKTMQAAHNALRRSVQGEESNKMDNEPVRKAERFFKTGRMVDPDGKEIEVLVGNKIDSVAVGGMYPTSTTGLAPVVDLTKLRGMTMEGGLAPDLAAEMFGFSSGDQLIRALAELKPFKDELKERTDARMLDEHGGMNTEAEKEEAVNKALANEVRARIVAIENRYLTKVKTPVAVIQQGAKELARTILGRMAIKDIKPRNYVASEARVAKDKHTAVKAMQSPETAGKSAYTRSFNEQIAAGVEESVAASEALVKSVEAIKRAQAKIDAHKKQYGDVDPAIVAMKASHQQVIQGQLAKEGYKILEEVDKALAYVKRIVSDVNRKNMGADHADQIEAILERFGLMGKYVAPTTRTPLATWAQVQQDIGFDIEIPDIVQESVRKNFLELTPEELQDVIDTVKQIAHTGKAQQLVLTMDRKTTFQKANTEIVDSINANAGGRKAKTETASTNIGRSVEAIGAFFAAHLKAAIIVQIMDGGKEAGKLWNYLVRSANNAANKETTMRAAATKRISEILDPVFKNGKMGGAGVYFPSVDRSLNREQVLVIALNMGNEGNMQRLLDGRGWTIEQVMPIIQTLTAAELNAVQEIWDHSEIYKTEIIEMYRRTAGREPQMLEPKPLQVMSADGQMVSLKGGYYPAKYDPKASARTSTLSATEQALRDLRDARMASTTRNSYAKPRSKEVHDRPLLLNLSALYSGIGEVIHDLSWREWLIDANRLMRSSSFDKAVREQYGSDFLKQIKTWIEDVAAGDKGVTNAGEMVANFLRQGISAAGLTFNIMSAAGQITGFAQSVIKVGVKWIGRGIAASVTNPKAAIERVYALSPFMASRGRTQFRELNEIKNMVQGESVAMKRVKAGGYFLMLQMQRVVDIPTWIGAYEKQLSINSDEKLAIAIADQAVIDSQGGGMLKDLSAIERGGPLQKLFTVFYSFMNTNLNLAVLKGMTEKNAGKWVAQQAMLWVAPVVTMYMLKKLLTPQSGDDDKWDLNEIAKELAAEELSFLMGSFMGIRELAPIAPIITGAKTYGTDYRGPAGLRMLGDTITFATQARQREFDTAFRKAAINIIGDGAGLPSAQINRTIDGIEALLEGETENITAPLFGVKKR